MLTIEEFKEYARIDADELTIQTMMLSASSYFKNRGVEAKYLTDPDDHELLKLGMMMLMTHYYENRGIVTEQNIKKIPKGIDTIVFDLKMRCAVNKRMMQS